MNKYLKNLNRVEFIITRECTGKCRHCSGGGSSGTGEFLDAEVACRALSDITRAYNITSVMTFGGEPLLRYECVCKIHSAARNLGIEKCQIITNGFFSADAKKIKTVAKEVALCGANDILLSVDAFHQETIPIDKVLLFAEELLCAEASLRLNPAWLVSRTDRNPYNLKTMEILERFKALGIKAGEGNIIFPRGNAIRYLKEYFDSEKEYKNPYEEDGEDVRSISLEPDGTVFGQSVRERSIIEILDGYRP